MDDVAKAIIFGAVALIDHIFRKENEVISVVKRYFNSVSDTWGIDKNLFINNFKVELEYEGKDKVKMITQISLSDKFGRSYPIKPDVSIVGIDSIPQNLRKMVIAGKCVDATPEIQNAYLDYRRL